jgi:hypothetical protein
MHTFPHVTHPHTAHLFLACVNVVLPRRSVRSAALMTSSRTVPSRWNRLFTPWARSSLRKGVDMVFFRYDLLQSFTKTQATSVMGRHNGTETILTRLLTAAATREPGDRCPAAAAAAPPLPQASRLAQLSMLSTQLDREFTLPPAQCLVSEIVDVHDGPAVHSD